jgi:hypothetical protein
MVTTVRMETSQYSTLSVNFSRQSNYGCYQLHSFVGHSWLNFIFPLSDHPQIAPRLTITNLLRSYESYHQPMPSTSLTPCHYRDTKNQSSTTPALVKIRSQAHGSHPQAHSPPPPPLHNPLPPGPTLPWRHRSSSRLPEPRDTPQ